MQYVNFILDPSNDYLGHNIDYLKICGFSILVAIIIGVTLGALVSRNAFPAFLARNAMCFLRLFPTISVLIFFLHIFATVFFPASIALIVIGIPPILLN